jgi:hypothetical protein
MKVSKQTLDTLKNFASINSNILVRPGNILSTISSDVSIFARAEVTETFDREFAIYDLNSLLALLTMMEDTDVEFGEDCITISKDSSEFKYYYADKSIIVAAPDKTIEVDNEYEFQLSSKTISMLIRAASVISAPMLSIVSKNGSVKLSVGDPATPRSNTYTQEIGTNDTEFDCRVPIENFKVIPADYKVVLSKKKFMHLSNEKSQYWLALDLNSKI